MIGYTIFTSEASFVVRYIKSSNEYAYSSKNPTIYGYLFTSTMTGINIMFCHEDEDYLAKRVGKIYYLLVEKEDAEGEYQEYCDHEGIHIVDDEYGDLIETDEGFIAEIDGEAYDVIIIAEDSGRF